MAAQWTLAVGRFPEIFVSGISPSPAATAYGS